MAPVGGMLNSPSTRPSKAPVSRPVRRLQVGCRDLSLIFVIASLYISMQAAAVQSVEDEGGGPKIHATLLSFVAAHAGQATQQAAGRQADSDPPILSPSLLKTLARRRSTSATRNAASGTSTASADITSDGNSAESYYTEVRVRGKLAPNASEPAVAEVLLSLGVDTYRVDLKTGMVSCWMPTSSIALLSEQTSGYFNAWLPEPAMSQDMSQAMPQAMSQAMPQAMSGSTHSQGDYVMRTDLVRRMLRLDGSGVKVGILADSFNALGGMAADISAGDLPLAGNIQILKDLASQGDRGRAMAQIVHDVAPGSSIAFYTLLGGMLDTADGILALQAAGCQVIVDEHFYIEEPYFSDGAVAMAVDQVKSQGVAYFSAAGNSGHSGYSAPFRNSRVLLTDADWGTVGYMHDFDPDPAVTSTRLSLTIPSGGAYIALQWDNLFYTDGPTAGTPPGANYDLDCFLYQGNDMMWFLAWYNILVDDPSASGDPIEFLWISTPGSYDLRIVHWTGAGPSHMHFFCFNGCTLDGGVYGTGSATIYGHAKAAGAITVGAAYYLNTPWNGVSPPEIESFSSRGGVTVYFDDTGNYIPAGIIRQKPEVVGPDGVDTTVPLGADTDSSGASNWFRTGAAASHVAALAALMLQYQPSLTPDMIASILKQTAVDMGCPGVDLDSGYGLVNATGVFLMLAKALCYYDATAGNVISHPATCVTDMAVDATAEVSIKDCDVTTLDLTEVALAAANFFQFIPICAIEVTLAPQDSVTRRHLLQVDGPSIILCIKVYVEDPSQGTKLRDLMNSLAFRQFLAAFFDAAVGVVQNVDNVRAVLLLRSTATSDPHFTTPHGQKFDFNGEANKTYCIVTDAALHVNAHFTGASAGGNELPAATSSRTRPDKRTWMDEVGILAGGVQVLVSAESPAGTGYSLSPGTVTVNGVLLNGRQGIHTLPSGMSILRKKTRVTVSMPHVVTVAVEIVRASFWEGGKGPEKNFLNLRLMDFKPTSHVHGILGRAYWNESNGMLVEDPLDYQTSSILATDCHFGQYARQE